MNIDEDQLAADIYAKLKTDPSISYSEIANKAFDTGRKKLALSVSYGSTNTMNLWKFCYLSYICVAFSLLNTKLVVVFKYLYFLNWVIQKLH